MQSRCAVRIASETAAFRAAVLQNVENGVNIQVVEPFTTLHALAITVPALLLLPTTQRCCGVSCCAATDARVGTATHGPCVIVMRGWHAARRRVRASPRVLMPRRDLELVGKGLRRAMRPIWRGPTSDNPPHCISTQRTLEKAESAFSLHI